MTNEKPMPSTDAARAVDPIALSVIWNGLIAVADDMGLTLRKTAYSAAVREGDDFSTPDFNLNADGQLANIEDDFEQVTQELRILGSINDNTDLIAGVYWSDSEVTALQNIGPRIEAKQRAAHSRRSWKKSEYTSGGST